MHYVVVNEVEWRDDWLCSQTMPSQTHDVVHQRVWVVLSTSAIEDDVYNAQQREMNISNRINLYEPEKRETMMFRLAILESWLEL